MGRDVARYVVDCGVALHLAAEGIDVSAEHELLAPTLLRSQVLTALHEAVTAASSRGTRPSSVVVLAPVDALRGG